MGVLVSVMLIFVIGAVELAPRGQTNSHSSDSNRISLVCNEGAFPNAIAQMTVGTYLNAQDLQRRTLFTAQDSRRNCQLRRMPVKAI